MTLLGLSLIYNVHEVIGQDEGYALASESEFLLEVAQYVAEINVKQLPGLLDHYIVGMPVGYSENVRRDAIARAAQSEFLDSLVQRRFRVIVVF